jgi:hypothetical protein
MKTFEQLQTDVFTQLKEEVSDTGFWSIQEIKDAINDTYLFIADETYCFRMEDIIEVKANVRIYKLPENYIYGSLNRVEFDDEVISPITSLELDAINRSWRTTPGDPTHYLPPGDICNTDELAVYPLPDTDGAVYNLASESKDRGVITTVGDDSYEEFESEEGIVVDSTGEAKFDELEGTGPVLEIKDSTNNLKVFGARYPKRLFENEETFLHPVTYNPRKVLTIGSLAILLAKEGEGKDIAKASYHNKRFMERIDKLFKKPKIKRFNRVRSITEFSIGQQLRRGLNLGDNYPEYPR